MNMQSSTDHATYEERASYQNTGLILGPVIFAVMMLAGNFQTAMDPIAWKTAAAGLLMATWWATEALPVPVTAFLPIVLFAPLGIANLQDSAAPYANPIIYLYLGGFMLALAVEKWNLHRRIALLILSHTGTDGRRLIGGFMLTSALLSMWMTNTSTTMMLLPIALSVIGVITENVPNLDKKNRDNFQTAMLLGLAFSATIGGLATLVGTPPNALLIGFLNESYDLDISFARWMLIGVPVSAVMLPIAWLTLTRFVFPVDIQESDEVKSHLGKMHAEIGPMTKAERRVAVIFSCVIALWMLRRPLSEAFNISGLSDPGIVMAAAVLLFLIPSGSNKTPQLMSWHDANRLPWGVLVLFGGGLSLAAAVSASGLAAWLGASLAIFGAFGVTMLVLAAVIMVIFLTELTSNLATTATFLPVMGAIALEAGVPPLVLLVPVTLAASCAFMLPVATPPNAIVFASGMIKIPQMIRAGLVLNLAGAIVLALISLFWAPVVLQ
ncbi:MAG: DASS family sodium-coupled anion symporter [Pseudomonadales bacterium]